MWILPKQLHNMSAFVPDMAALISDLAEQSQICEQSLLARSKPSLARTWSQKWKRDSWTQLLSGRILKPSHGQTFVTAWTSSLEVIPASHSQQPESDLEKTTLDTSGHGLQMELFPCDPESASSRMSKDTSALDSERSLANWKALVTKRRGEYSLRVKSAHLINGSECSSWPTAKARDWKDTMGCSLDATNPDGTHRNRRDRLVGAIVAETHGRQFHVSPNTNGSLPESWATPRLGGEEKAETRLARGKDIWLHGQVGAMTNSAKLNPRWVETLMGLPIGWTMPSCSSPLTIALTNSDYSETESCQPPQPELF